jgi:hypothetical protein
VVDVFEEVDERLRSDRYRTLALKGLPWALAAVAAIAAAVAIVWGLQAYSDANAQKASQAYARGLDALARGDAAAAFNQFGEAATSPSKAYRALALMQQAGIRLDRRRTPEAVALFDRAAAAAPNDVIGDAARLKSALALLDTAAYGDIEARLKPLMAPQHPYGAQAREALAMAKLNAGRISDARSDFVVLSLLPSATDDIRERAHAATTLIDSGSAAALPSIVKAALALPPAPAGPPDSTGPSPSDQTSQAGAAQ